MTRALVTGASAGLGLAVARRLLGEGAAVVGVDRSRPAEGLAEGYAHRQCDLSDADAVDGLADGLANGLEGPFDLAVMCAGISATGRFERLPVEAHARVLAVNAEAPLVLSDALVGSGALRGGALVLVASLSVDVGYPGAASYAASKDALAAYAVSLRRARTGVRVVCVLPGPIRTDHAARHAPDGSSDRSRMDPDDLARRILVAARGRGGVLRPGFAASVAGLAGRIAPGLTARAMRRGLFEKLDRDVW